MVEQIAMRCGLWQLVGFASAEGSNPRQTMAHVKGIGNLSELAIADAVDPCGDLISDHLVHRGGEASLKSSLIELLAHLPRLQKSKKLGRSRQAADMGGQDAVGAVIHGNLPRLTLNRCTSAHFGQVLAARLFGSENSRGR